MVNTSTSVKRMRTALPMVVPLSRKPFAGFSIILLSRLAVLLQTLYPTFSLPFDVGWRGSPITGAAFHRSCDIERRINLLRDPLFHRFQVGKRQLPEIQAF